MTKIGSAVGFYCDTIFERKSNLSGRKVRSVGGDAGTGCVEEPCKYLPVVAEYSPLARECFPLVAECFPVVLELSATAPKLSHVALEC